MSWVTIVGLVLTLLIFIPLVWQAVSLIFAHLALRERRLNDVVISLEGLSAWCKAYPEKIPLVKIQEYVTAHNDTLCLEILDEGVVVRGRKFPQQYILFFNNYIIFD